MTYWGGIIWTFLSTKMNKSEIINEAKKVLAVEIKSIKTLKTCLDNQFYNVVKNYMNEGATILGGCCEIKPSHIKVISELIT